MNKEIAQYINTLLADRERLLDEREDAIEETKAELANIYQAQKSMDYIIEEAEDMEDDPNAEFDAASYT